MVTSVTNPDNQILTFVYDALGQRDYMVNMGGSRTTYTYNALGQLDNLINGNNERTTFVYDSLGRKTSKYLANSSITSFSYDANYQVKNIVHNKSDSSIINSVEYQYDANGNRISQLEANGDHVTYTYDATNQIKTEHRAGVFSVAPFRTTFTYDNLGNRTLQEADSTITTQTYNAVNQLLTSVETTGITTHTYDNDGNQLTTELPTNQITTNIWDYENRLQSVALPTNKTITYTYAITRRNGEEMRVKKEDDTTTTKYIWDAANIITETDGLNNITAQFTYNPVAYGNLISMQRGNNTTFYHFDALGSTQALTDSSETITDSYSYNAFGETIDSSGATINPYQYVGEFGYYYDVDTGLYTLCMREYHAGVGRFVSFDPLHFNAGDLNLYRYVGNSTFVSIDPNGHANKRIFSRKKGKLPKFCDSKHLSNYYFVK